MTDEERKILVAEIIRIAKEGRAHTGMNTVPCKSLSRIIRLARRIQIEKVGE